jgi:hypothetical protein
MGGEKEMSKTWKRYGKLNKSGNPVILRLGTNEIEYGYIHATSGYYISAYQRGQYVADNTLSPDPKLRAAHIRKLKAMLVNKNSRYWKDQKLRGYDR